MLDKDWPRLKVNFERWLSEDGKVSLSALNGSVSPG
jgi:hypothetical protein